MQNPTGISRRIGLNAVPDIQTYNTSTPVSQLHQPAVLHDEYNQFNLQNIMHIFDGPMAHITNDKVKTNVFTLGQA